MNCEIIKEETDKLTNASEQLKALLWIFAEQYTRDNAEGVIENIKANPTAYSYLFSMIEDKALEVDAIASSLLDMAYQKTKA